MLIIAGRLHVVPEAREAFLIGCEEVVGLARAATGCFDFALSADVLDVSRINVYERWDTEEHLLAFRGSGPDDGQQGRITDATVRRYVIDYETDA